MNRPLVITDCDEVLLHMVRHFREWLDEQHGIDFLMAGKPFIESMTHRDSAALVQQEEVFTLLDAFFDTEMQRQTAIEGAVDAIAELQKQADVVVLTNLQDRFAQARTRQLQAHGIVSRVYTNQGPKGAALARIVREFDPVRAAFIDDLAHHHHSVAEEQPDVVRLHFCGEPAISGHVPCAQVAGHAHARIDNWADALPWLTEQLHGEKA